MQAPSSSILWRIAIGAMLVVPWAILLWSRLAPEPEIVYSDGISVTVTAEKAASRTIVWDRPEFFEIQDAAGDDFSGPAFSPDGKSLVFTRGRMGQNTGLWICQQLLDEAGWSNPVAIAALETPSDEMGAAWSPDGNRLYFSSSRTGGAGGFDIWSSQKTGDVWGVPINAGPFINTDNDETDPALLPAGDRLFFTSDRDGADLDIYSVSLNADEPAVAVEALNSYSNDGQVAFTPRGDFAYFSSERRGGRGGFDLYRARLREGRFETPVNLGEMVNSWADEMNPSLTLEGFQLAFSSDRGSGPLPLTGKPSGIFFTVSREVEVVVDDDAAGSWAGLELTLAGFIKEWRGVLVWLGMALVGYGILAFAQNRGSVEPSLRQRCFAVSLLVHALLLGVFTAWTLTEALLEEPRGPAIEMALNADSLAAEKLSMEIRQNVVSLPGIEAATALPRFAVSPDLVEVEAPGLQQPDLPEAEPVERPPVDPLFQFAEAGELAPVFTKPFPGIILPAVEEAFVFVMQIPVLDIGQPAPGAEAEKLAAIADATGESQPPDEIQMTPGDPVLKEVPTIEDATKLVPASLILASQTPESAGELVPQILANISFPLSSITPDPLATTASELVPKVLELGPVQPQEADPSHILAPIPDTLARARQVGPPVSPQMFMNNAASLELENPVTELAPPILTAEASNERSEIHPVAADLSAAATDRPIILILPQMLSLANIPPLELQ